MKWWNYEQYELISYQLILFIVWGFITKPNCDKMDMNNMTGNMEIYWEFTTNTNYDEVNMKYEQLDL